MSNQSKLLKKYRRVCRNGGFIVNNRNNDMYGLCKGCGKYDQYLDDKMLKCSKCHRVHQHDEGYKSSDQPVFSTSYDNDSYTSSYDSGSFSGGSFD